MDIPLHLPAATSIEPVDHTIQPLLCPIQKAEAWARPSQVDEPSINSVSSAANSAFSEPFFLRSLARYCIFALGIETGCLLKNRVKYEYHLQDEMQELLEESDCAGGYGGAVRADLVVTRRVPDRRCFAWAWPVMSVLVSLTMPPISLLVLRVPLVALWPVFLRRHYLLRSKVKGARDASFGSRCQNLSSRIITLLSAETSAFFEC